MARNTTKQPTVGTHDDDRVVGEVMAWAKDVWSAVQKESTYGSQHDRLFKEFDRLRDVIKLAGDPRLQDHRCLIFHVAPIYNHTASQGYQADIHYQPLSQAVSQWCLKQPVKPWKAPPDQYSPSASPKIPPRPTPRPVSRVVTTPAPLGPPKADKGKAKAKVHLSPEFVDSESDARQAAPKVEGKKVEGKANAKTSAEPDAPRSNPTDEMKEWDPKCERCEAGQHACHVNPNRPGPNSACFECNSCKVRCSRVGKEDKTDGDVPKKKSGGIRKKPIAVPAGEPGQSAGAFVLLSFFFGVQVFQLW